MKSELNNIGKEFLNSEEIYQSINQESIVPMELSMPVGEFTECAPEFIDVVQSVDDKSEESVQKNKERKKNVLHGSECCDYADTGRHIEFIGYNPKERVISRRFY